MAGATRSRSRGVSGGGGEASSSSESPGFEAQLPMHLLVASFPDRELATETAAQFALDNGFQISIRSSTATTKYLCCRRGRYKPKPAPSRPKAYEGYLSYTDCPYGIKIAPSSREEDRFVLQQLHARHNHAPFPEGMDPDALRRGRSAKRARLAETVEQNDGQEQAPPSGLTSTEGPPNESSAAEPSAAADETSTPTDAPTEPPAEAPTDATADVSKDTMPASTVNPSTSAGSIARSDITMRTDTSAAAHLLNLRLGPASFSSPRSIVPPPKRNTSTSISSTSNAMRSPALLTSSSGTSNATSTSSVVSSPAASTNTPGTSNALSSPALSIEAALGAVLDDPPFDCLLVQVVRLDKARAKQALVWANALVKALQMHVELKDHTS